MNKEVTMHTKTCKNCSKEFQTTNNVKKFCERVCYAKFHSKDKLRKFKEDKEYRKKQLERTYSWRQKNRKKYDAYQKDYQKAYVEKNKEEIKAYRKVYSKKYYAKHRDSILKKLRKKREESLSGQATQ